MEKPGTLSNNGFIHRDQVTGEAIENREQNINSMKTKSLNRQSKIHVTIIYLGYNSNLALKWKMQTHQAEGKVKDNIQASIINSTRKQRQ